MEPLKLNPVELQRISQHGVLVHEEVRHEPVQKLLVDELQPVLLSKLPEASILKLVELQLSVIVVYSLPVPQELLYLMLHDLVEERLHGDVIVQMEEPIQQVMRVSRQIQYV